MDAQVFYSMLSIGFSQCVILWFCVHTANRVRAITNAVNDLSKCEDLDFRMLMHLMRHICPESAERIQTNLISYGLLKSLETPDDVIENGT